MSGDTSLGAAPWPNYALPHGTVVNGYRIERVLGSGGFGVTYLARDLLQQPFAIKEYYPRQFAIRQELKVLAASAEDEALFEECRERFLREAQALVRLTRVAGAGDGIVRVQTYFEAHGTCFLVMDYIEGASLASVLQKAPGGLEAARVRTLLTQLLSAIGVVHRAGLMHRDIKPANIILRDDDRVVLIDFGSSREATSGQTTAYTQIYSGGYAPPEQMLGGMRQGAFSDIYAIGAVCYRAIGGTVADALARQIALAGGRADPQPPAAQIGAGRYPASLLAAIDAALAVDATQRPQDVDAMRAVLGRDEPVTDATVVAPRRPVQSATLPPPLQPGKQRWRGVWGVAAGVGAVVVAGAAYLVLRGPATPTPADRVQVAASSPAPVALPPVATPQGQGRTAQPAASDGVAQPTPAQSGPAAAPTGAPAPVAPAGPPQDAAMVPPPAPASTPAPMPAPTSAQAGPAAVSTSAPAPVAPTEPPQHAAMVPLPAPAPTPAPTPTQAGPAAAPTGAPAPVAPTGPPQHAATVPPAAPPPTPVPSAPEAASTSAPAAVSPAELPQRQAMVVLPPAPAPTPAPSPPALAPPTLAPPALASPLERARAAASDLPCSILHVASGQDGLRVSGVAPPGLDLDRLLAGLRDLGRVAENITRADGFDCAPMEAVGKLARLTWDATPPTLAIRLDQREVAGGARLEINLTTTLPVLYVDLFANGTPTRDLFPTDATVRHLLRPAPSGKVGKPHVEWIAASSPGPRLIVAMGSATPLDLGARPETENAADYLAVLRAGLERATGPTSADVAMVTVRAGEPAVAPAVAKVPQPRPTNVRSERCANIVSRAQLGETLSDADRAALRTECRS